MDTTTLIRGNGDFTHEQFREVLCAANDDHLMLSLGLTLGPGCNMRCIYCYSADSKDNEADHFIGTRMKLEDYERAIAQSAALGAQSVVIVGVGETMMDRYFTDVIELCSHHGLIPLIFTNGTLLDRDMVQFLRRHQTTIYLSLDSVDEYLFNKITQTEGVFSSVMNGIENCLAAGYGKITERNGHAVTDFALNTMVMKANVNHLKDIVRFSEERNILFTCRLPEKLGRATEYWQDLIAETPEEEQRIRDEVSKYSRGEEVFHTDHGCLFWVAGVLLGLDGRARLCYSLDNKQEFGNICRNSMKEIIRKKFEVYPPTDSYFCPLHDELLCN